MLSSRHPSDSTKLVWPIVLLLMCFLPLNLTNANFVFFNKSITIIAIFIAAYASSDRIPVAVRMACASFFVIISSSIQILLPVLPGPDAVKFHSLIDGGFAELLMQAASHFQLDALPFIPSTYFFPLLLSTIASGSLSARPETISLYNGILMFWMAGTWVGLLARTNRPALSKQKFLLIVYIVITCNFSIIYWSSVFNKDITALTLAVAAVSLALDRRFFPAIFALLIATFVRNYAIAMAVAFYVFFVGDRRLQVAALSIAVSVLLVLSVRESAILINSLFVFVYIFLSPNPARQNNWEMMSSESSWDTAPVFFTIEGVTFGAFLVFGLLLLLISSKGRRFELLSLLISIFVLASVLTLVGHDVVESGNEREYGLLVVGDNIVRKKLIAWPLVCTFAGLVVHRLLVSFVGQRPIEVARP